MKTLVAPHKKVGYEPSGIKALPSEQRKRALFDLLNKTNESPDLTKFRLNRLNEMRGNNR